MSIISASTTTTTALQYTADTTGTLVFKTGATPTTALTINADQTVSFAGAVTFASAGFTNLSYTGTLTGGTGVVNLGSGQFYKDASGNVGVGITPTNASGYTTLDASNATNGARVRLLVGSTPYGIFYTNGTTDVRLMTAASVPLLLGTNYAESMRIDSSGNVGIGTSSPSSLLHVNVSTSGGGGIFSRQSYNYATVSTVGSSVDAVFGGGVIASATNGEVVKTVSDVAHFVKVQISDGITFHTNITGAAGTSVSRNTNERMRITSAGNVGINTASPGAILDVGAGQLWKRVGVANGDRQGVQFGLQPGHGSYRSAILGGPENYGGTDSGNLTFHTQNGYVVSDIPPERMRIDSSGNLFVGTTTATGGRVVIGRASNEKNLTLQNTGTLSGGTPVLEILPSTNTTNNSYYTIQTGVLGVAYRFQVADSGNVTNTNNSYGAISDVKLKENIVDATPKLEALCNVKVRNFNFIGSEDKQLGVIAQELETVFPSMIDEAPDKDMDGNNLGTTTKQVKYSVFVPMLIKAIQELKAEFDEYKATHP